MIALSALSSYAAEVSILAYSAAKFVTAGALFIALSTLISRVAHAVFKKIPEHFQSKNAIYLTHFLNYSFSCFVASKIVGALGYALTLTQVLALVIIYISAEALFNHYYKEGKAINSFRDSAYETLCYV